MTKGPHADISESMTKYFAKRIKNTFGTFDSQMEYERYLVLKDMKKKGLITKLEQHPRFEILPQLKRTEVIQLKTKTKTVERVEEKAVHYTADFSYYENGVRVIEEVKSEGTRKARDYPLRRKLMKHLIYRHNQDGDKWVFREVGTKKSPKRKAVKKK